MSVFDVEAAMAELGAALADRWKARSPAERRAYSAFEAHDTDEPHDEADQAESEANAGWWQHREPSAVAFQPTSFSNDLPIPKMSEVSEIDGWPTQALPEGSGESAPSRNTRLAATKTELERAEVMMALSGAVNPADLMVSGSRALDREVLDLLAPRCDRTLVGGSNTWSWVLKAEARDETLRKLTPDALRAILAVVRDLPTDESGKLLRSYAASGNIPALAGDEIMQLPALQTAIQALADDEIMQLPALQTAIQAMAWANPLNSAIGPVLASARREAAIASLVAGYDRLLSDGFLGRKTQVGRIRSFIDALPTTPARGESIPVLGVSGIGGSGKSTLLAHTLRQLVIKAARLPDSPIVINIDFDRLRFIEGGELEWSFEFTRQIALFIPGAAHALEQERSAARLDRDARGEEQKQASVLSESVLRDSHSFDDKVGTLLRSAELWKRKVVIVLDTFEEWQREAWATFYTEMPAFRLFEWVSNLSRALALTPGLIVSGRAPLRYPGFNAAAEPIQLEDLPTVQAAALLRKFGVNRKAAQLLTKTVGGNPLALKLAARYYLALPEEARAGFASDSSGSLTGLDVALRQGVLYRRFLDHIPDDAVRQLAHPGLAVRRVTPEIVREILAVPCGLGTVSLEDAHSLLARLEREAWLVERDGDALVHRPDVRRSMLRLMATDPIQGPRVRAVHEAAVRWFDEHSDRDGTFEGAYHKLALAEPTTIDWKQFAPPLLLRLSQLAGDFSDAMRARLRDAAGVSLSAEDAALLPEDLRRGWAERRAADLVRRRQPQGALRFWRTSGQEARDAPWLIQASFQAPDWSAATTISKTKLRQERLSFAMLLAFVRQDQEALPPIMEVLWIQERMRRSEFNGSERAMPTYMRAKDYEHFERPAPEIRLENRFFAAVINPTHPSNRDADRPRGTETLDPNAKGLGATEIRRIATVSPEHPVLTRYDVRRFLAQCFRPDPSWLRRLGEALRGSGANPEPFSAFLRRFDAAMVDNDGGTIAPSSAELLGSWAGQFSNAVVACMATPPTTAIMMPIVGLRGDDPEWRVPICNILAKAYRAPADFARFAARLDGILPRDLVASELAARHARAPRAMWVQLVEYFDRIGALRRLCAAAAQDANAAVQTVVTAYQRWDDACSDCIRRSI